MQQAYSLLCSDLCNNAFRFPKSILPAAVLSFGFAFWASVSVDLTADAQSGVLLVLLPILTLAPLAIGAVIGLFMDLRYRRIAKANAALSHG